jgi:putative membrane protein
MSVIRTSLSLIGFGFTIFQFFEKLKQAERWRMPRRRAYFGTCLVLLGEVMLVLGIVYHVQFMLGLREERAAMKEAGLIHGESNVPVSLTLVTAVIRSRSVSSRSRAWCLAPGPFD